MDTGGVLVGEAQPGVRGDRGVEASGGWQIADADPQVVDAAVRHGVIAVDVNRLHAVAVGSSRKAP